MIIPVHIKSATILKCQTSAKRHPLIRALNIKFGFDPECQLVFRIYEDWNLRKERLTAKLAFAGPEDGQRWEWVIDVEEEYIPVLTAWKMRRKCKPFTYYLSVTEEVEERIKDHQKFFKNASYPVHVGQGFNHTIQTKPCPSNSSEKSHQKPSPLRWKLSENQEDQSDSKPLKLKLSPQKEPESVTLKVKSETGRKKLRLRKMKLG